MSWLGFSQPPFNSWFSLGRPQTEMLSTVATDSCYYASFLAIDNDTSLQWDQFFLTLDLNGNVINQKFLHSDTTSINGYGSRIIKTKEGGLVTICGFGHYYLFCNYDPVVDTIYQVLIDSAYNYHSLSSGGLGKILQREVDSTFYFISQVQLTTDQSQFLAIFHLDKNGQLLNFNKFPLEFGFFSYRAEDIIDEGDGICFSSYIIKVGGVNADDRRHIRLAKVDYDLNLIWTWTDWDNLLDGYPRGLIKTVDDGYIYGGISGEHLSQTNSFSFKARITKLNSDKTLDWELELGDCFHPDLIRFNDIVQKSDSRFVAAGHKLTDSMTVGWLIEFDIDGNLIWESEFNFAPSSLDDDPRHIILDLEQTPDNGYILSGTAHNTEMTSQGVFGRFGWLVKTDSVGCLIPGCQDFLSAEEPEPFEIQVYPNPASDYLYIRANVGQAKGQKLQIFDLSGQLVQEFNAASFDMSYILDVSGYEAGVYYLVFETEAQVVTQRFVVVH